MDTGDLALGIDIGTSGVRTAVVERDGRVISTARASHAEDSNRNANAWWDSVQRALHNQVAALQEANINPLAVSRACVDGTSGSMVLIDTSLEPTTPALMYNSSGFDAEAVHIARFAEPGSITQGSSSALARMLRLQSLGHGRKASHLLHQADFIAAKLAGKAIGSDDNNALKLGWDPQTRTWPAWFEAAGVRTDCLPFVATIGHEVATIDPQVATKFGVSPNLVLHAGTTDSIAAFLASGAHQQGDAVTSLGTTLAIKLLSANRIDAPEFGIYSHKVGNNWLVGGASNTGAGVLAMHFSSAELEELSHHIDPDTPSGLDYYPLPKAGQRFPINDPALEPRIDPRPTDNALFLKGLLEGIARIEAQGFAKLQELGAPAPKRIFSAGGGAKNPTWSAIRAKLLPAPLHQAQEIEASVGVARLCWQITV